MHCRFPSVFPVGFEFCLLFPLRLIRLGFGRVHWKAKCEGSVESIDFGVNIRQATCNLFFSLGNDFRCMPAALWRAPGFLHDGPFANTTVGAHFAVSLLCIFGAHISLVPFLPPWHSPLRGGRLLSFRHTILAQHSHPRWASEVEMTGEQNIRIRVGFPLFFFSLYPPSAANGWLLRLFFWFPCP
ncbi:uncharacterized protein BDZ99DRAFT_164319 [Mytilinidion resinicola]|uniref:Uncharacterized protein n=1 Tax=Mytilinidion resinicola TaxID=574789 RepID=A0A6A6Y7S5_9PEZI|nr:uncharacterized protein BDZ99DRAFT_164319 [Mytilinidion resinicola]KAF2803857.1 hypothetical protein BDZ99DRAFT_164319 [Mytilinidion resinicola]